MAGLLDLSPELLKKVMQNAYAYGSQDYLGGGSYIPADNGQYAKFGLSGSPRGDSGVSNVNAEIGQGNNSVGVDYNKYYIPMPNVQLPEAIQSQLYALSNQAPASLLNLYYRRQF